MNKHMNERPQSFRKVNKNTKVSKEIENIVFKCLEKIKIKDPIQLMNSGRYYKGQTILLPKNIQPMPVPGVLAIILSILVIPLVIYTFFLSKKKKKTFLLRVVWFYFRVKTKKIPVSPRNTDDPGNVVSRSESSHLPLIAEKIKSNHLTEFMNDNDNKYYNKAVDNIQKI